MPRFQPHDQALIKGSFEVVEVVIQFGDTVLVKRAGGQMAFDARKLEPYSDVCPLAT